MTAPDAPDGATSPHGQPPTTEDQRGEHQPAGAEASEESRRMADAVEDPEPGR
jgi:hypothetical protein